MAVSAASARCQPPPRPKQGSSQCDASSAQREPPLPVPVSEDPACREVCDGVVAPSDDPISDGRRCPEENPDSNASSVGEETESSDDVVIVGWSRPTLERRSKLKNFIVPVKIEKPWDSGYLASYHRGFLQATTGTPCQGISKGAKTTSSGNERTVETKRKACSAVLTCTRLPKVPGEITPKKARGRGRPRAAKNGAAGCEKKTAVDSAVKPFEPAAVKKLKAIQSALTAPMSPPKPRAAAATKSKPRGRKKKQEMVPAVGTNVRRGSAGAEATPRFNKTAVRRVKNGERPAPSRKVPSQVQSTYELHRRFFKNGRNLEVAVTASIAEAAAVQVAGKGSKCNDDPPVDRVNANQVNTVPAADEAPLGASTSKRNFVPHELNSSLEASDDVAERRTERLPQGASTAVPHGSSMDLRPVCLQDKISVAFKHSTLQGVILFPDRAAGSQATLPSTAAPDLKGSDDKGVMSTDASASTPLQYSSLQSPVESSYARTCNEAASPTQPQRSAATSTQAECIEDSHGTEHDSSVPVEASSHGPGTAAEIIVQAECIEDSHGTEHDSSVPVELSSPGPGTAAEIIAREPSDKVATNEEATSAAVDVIKSTSEKHSLSSPGASTPLESASPESIPVVSSDTRTSNEAALPTKFQRSAAASRKSGCIKVSQGTQCNYRVPVEASSPGEGTAAEVVVCEPSGNVSTMKEATSAEVDAMKSIGDTHSVSAPGDYRDKWKIPGVSSDARADNEGISMVRDAGAEEPVCWRENSSSKRRRTDDDVILISEPTPAVVESVRRECADGGEVLEMYEGLAPPTMYDGQHWWWAAGDSARVSKSGRLRTLQQSG
ncbi:hypothetical protein MRX96_007969 [Rhipicephalus microplus]